MGILSDILGIILLENARNVMGMPRFYRIKIGGTMPETIYIKYSGSSSDLKRMYRNKYNNGRTHLASIDAITKEEVDELVKKGVKIKYYND